MNPSLPTLSNGSRATSIGLVIGLHVALVLGLSAGLMRPTAKVPPAPPQVRVVDDKPLPPVPLHVRTESRISTQVLTDGRANPNPARKIGRLYERSSTDTRHDR